MNVVIFHRPGNTGLPEGLSLAHDSRIAFRFDKWISWHKYSKEFDNDYSCTIGILVSDIYFDIYSNIFESIFLTTTKGHFRHIIRHIFCSISLLEIIVLPSFLWNIHTSRVDVSVAFFPIRFGIVAKLVLFAIRLHFHRKTNLHQSVCSHLPMEYNELFIFAIQIYSVIKYFMHWKAHQPHIHYCTNVSHHSHFKARVFYFTNQVHVYLTFDDGICIEWGVMIRICINKFIHVKKW